MRSTEKIFIYYLADLISRGEKESVDTITSMAQSKELIPYLLKKDPKNEVGNLMDFSELGDAMAEYDYTLDPGKFLINDSDNGLAFLLCLIVNYN